MPVTATPIADNAGACTNAPVLPGSRLPSPVPVNCQGQRLIVPRTPKDAGTGKPILSRTFAIDIPGTRATTIKYVMRDPNGVPVDLSHCLCTPDEGSLSASVSVDEGDCACPYKMVFRMQEYLTGGKGCQFAVRITDAEAGEVEVDLSSTDTGTPGIYFGEFALIECDDDLTDNYREDTVVIFSNRIYVNIGRNLWNNRMSCTGPLGPPSIAEVRLHLRDTQSDESYLLDNVAFTDEEIALATVMPVQFWNEIPPSIKTHTTRTFPYRYHWLIAITGYLFLTVAEQQRRNNLTYAAGGVQVNDQNREPNYEQAAQRRLEEYKTFVRAKKASLNYEMGFASLGSPYGWR